MGKGHLLHCVTEFVYVAYCYFGAFCRSFLCRLHFLSIFSSSPASYRYLCRDKAEAKFFRIVHPSYRSRLHCLIYQSPIWHVPCTTKLVAIRLNDCKNGQRKLRLVADQSRTTTTTRPRRRCRIDVVQDETPPPRKGTNQGNK